MFTSLHLQEIKYVPDPERGIILFLRGSTLRQGVSGSSVVKNLPAIQETWVRSLDQEDPLEKEISTYSSTLPWKIPHTEEPEGLQPMVSLKSQTQTW